MRMTICGAYDQRIIPERRPTAMSSGPTTMKIIVILGVAALASGCATMAPSIQTGPDAEISFDGLHKVDNSQADEAWARPDIDLSGYTKLMPVTAGFQYTPTKNRGRTQLERNRGGPYVIDERSREQFEDLVSSVFQEEFAKLENWELVTEPGPDVLIIYGGLLDISSSVPPDDLGSRNRIYVTSIGEATLVLELRDSESGTVLARSVDRRAAERLGGQMFESNSVTNTSEVRRLSRFWAQRLVASLDNFKAAAGAN